MILISGATGTVGRQLVHQLAADDVPTRAISRKPEDTDLPVEVVFGDFDRPETLTDALHGVDAMFLLHGGQVAGDIDEVATAAVGAGVRRIVFLSSLAAGTRPDSVISRDQGPAERMLAERFDEVTVLRPGQFASNTLWWLEMIKSGTVRAPFGDVATPLIDPYDIAAVAKLALTAPSEAGHAGQVYTLTGPELLSPRQRVEIIAELLQREIGFVELPVDRARAEMLRTMPAEYADATLDLIGRPSAPERAVLPTVQQLLGRPARSFATWAADNRSVFG
ncbi:NAD(P)H-binding protein [Microlunatus soli]|uniref:Uncharacterized conserved protein YbjT, contains NAD(P)-binding and DUF2867 domains n=1 Tax=Microlunatus soli TaxID=630515 RepID=A0A1H1ZZY1_9ACTN|nr:NAD(P)H-binding protein [Microlunatus soli]SDT39274.1 Uncharacterized conserved protein YbjT, contains NAD(P)-binding and DUF2867 domains [Microlunatus soli]